MKLARRAVLRLAAGAAALPAARMAAAQDRPKQPPLGQSVAPLAARLAGYADRLRYEDIDAATIERVKTHLIDTIGSASAPLTKGRSVFAVTSRCPSTVTPLSSAPTGARQLSWRPSPMAPRSVILISTTPMSDASPFIPAIILRPVSQWRRPSGPASGI
jgi:hypothetical protein